MNAVEKLSRQTSSQARSCETFKMHPATDLHSYQTAKNIHHGYIKVLCPLNKLTEVDMKKGSKVHTKTTLSLHTLHNFVLLFFTLEGHFAFAFAYTNIIRRPLMLHVKRFHSTAQQLSNTGSLVCAIWHYVMNSCNYGRIFDTILITEVYQKKMSTWLTKGEEWDGKNLVNVHDAV